MSLNFLWHQHYPLERLNATHLKKFLEKTSSRRNYKNLKFCDGSSPGGWQRIFKIIRFFEPTGPATTSSAAVVNQYNHFTHGANICSSNVYGMDNNTKFNTYISALTQYTTREGHSKVPAVHIENFEEKEITLGAWVGYIRQRYRKGLLPQERIDKISQISNWQWGPFQPGPATDSKRNEIIRNMRTDGKSLREIADEFDLSRQRVHQIIKKLKIS